MMDRVAGETPIPPNVATAVRLLAHRVRLHKHELELNVRLRQDYGRPSPVLVSTVVELHHRRRAEKRQRVLDSEQALIALRQAVEQARQALEQAVEDAAIAGLL